jgi:hypothetical protein
MSDQRASNSNPSHRPGDRQQGHNPSPEDRQHRDDERPGGEAAGDRKPRMAVAPDSEPGLETDGHGNVIPLAQRTKEDQQKARGKPA